jgi:hypothetical protein
MAVFQEIVGKAAAHFAARAYECDGGHSFVVLRLQFIVIGLDVMCGLNKNCLRDCFELVFDSIVQQRFGQFLPKTPCRRHEGGFIVETAHALSLLSQPFWAFFDESGSIQSQTLLM